MNTATYWKILIASSSVLVCVIGAGTMLFMLLEPEWSFIDALYFTASSVFTVGYGDLTVGPGNYVVTGIFLIAACTIALAASSAIGNSFISILQHRAIMHRNKQLMLKVQKMLLEAKAGGLPDDEVRCLKTSLDTEGDDCGICGWMDRMKEQR
jgi:hypothetical protein